LLDFSVELTTLVKFRHEDSLQWILYVDGASNLKGSEAGVVLEGPDVF